MRGHKLAIAAVAVAVAAGAHGGEDNYKAAGASNQKLNSCHKY